MAKKDKVDAPNLSAKLGRPTVYTPALVGLICAKIADGSNLNLICAEEGFPSRDTVYAWLQKYPDFSDNYARAREDRADVRSDRIDGYVLQLLDGKIDANQARVAIDAEKWQAGKEKPKRYGDSIKLSGDPENPLTVVNEIGRSLDTKLDRLIGRRAEKTEGQPD